MFLSLRSHLCSASHNKVACDYVMNWLALVSIHVALWLHRALCENIMQVLIHYYTFAFTSNVLIYLTYSIVAAIFPPIILVRACLEFVEVKQEYTFFFFFFFFKISMKLLVFEPINRNSTNPTRLDRDHWRG